MSIVVARLTDEEQFEKEMARAENRIDAYYADYKICWEDEISDRAEKDANRLLSGESSYHVLSPVRNWLRSIDPEATDASDLGKKLYRLYCRKIQDIVTRVTPLRRLAFPEW
ncbi:hypothetical protein IJG96_00140 [Candidatus Saccharibacteria bacterium]|nr:hypothetical protein [Candidatus Saccharibacteria bacterium]